MNIQATHYSSCEISSHWMTSNPDQHPMRDCEVTQVSGSTDVSTRMSRRGLLAATGATLATLSGCSGKANTGSGGNKEGIETPWTTEDLAEKAKADESGKVVVYAGTGSFNPWDQIGEVIAEEYPWFEIDGVAGKGGQISQRILQEHQSGESEVDIISQGDEIYSDKDIRERLIKPNHDETYWFADDSEASEYATPWFASALNGGPSVGIGINPVELENRGLDVPNSWNDLLEDQYKDVPVIFPQSPNTKRFGWIVSYHAEEMGMEPTEWFQAQADHLDLRIVSGHTTGARFLGQGDAPLMHHNYPWVVRRFVDELNAKVHFPDPVPMFLSSGIVSEYVNAPHPWTARFFISVLMEDWVQKRIAKDVDEFGPGRVDIDYSGLGLGSYTERTLNTPISPIGFEEENKYKDLTETVYQDVLGQPETDL